MSSQQAVAQQILAAHAKDPAQKTGAQIVWEVLTRLGVEVVFGYPGGAIMPTYDAMPGYPIRHVLVRHEQGAAHMADGYARASGKVGVAIATSGPGATNLVTGIATAMLDSLPVVCITGQVSSQLIGSDAFQEIDITGITLPITKHNYLVTRAEDMAPALREAFDIARSGRPGPGAGGHHQGRAAGDRRRSIRATRRSTAAAPAASTAPRPDAIARAAELIDAAERPLILAGQGVMRSGASELLREFAEKTGIPVASTLLGLGGFPASHPLSLGMMGMHGEAWVNTSMQEADLLIALGMRFDDRVTGKLRRSRCTRRRSTCEIDPSEINKNVKVDVALPGDSTQTLEALVPSVQKRTRRGWLERIGACAGKWRAATCSAAVARQALRSARAARPLAAHRRQGAGGHRRRPAPDVGSAVLQARSPALADHLRRPGHDGLRAPRGDRRAVRPAPRRHLGGGRRRRVPDDLLRADHLRAGRDQAEHRHHQQRLPGHGPAVAGVLLQRPLRRRRR